MGTRTFAAARVALLSSAVLLSSCVGTTQPVAPCCYAGPYHMGRLASLPMERADGTRTTFGELFADFTPASGFLAPTLPFQEVQIAEVTYSYAHDALLRHDVNGDGRIEPPELALLYVQEAARGLGKAGQVPGNQALALSTVDVGGLMRWTRDNLHRMSPEAQATFAELDRLGLDLRTESEYGDGGDNGDGGGGGGFAN